MYCERLSPTFVLLKALFGVAAFADVTVHDPMISGLLDVLSGC
jgi:hypothetical protein